METNGNQNELKVKIIFNETKWKQNGNQNSQNELKVKIIFNETKWKQNGNKWKPK